MIKNHWLRVRDAKHWQATLEISTDFIGSTVMAPVMCQISRTTAYAYGNHHDSLNFRFTTPSAKHEALKFCDHHSFGSRQTTYFANIHVYNLDDELCENWALPDLMLMSHLIFPESINIVLSSAYINLIDSVYIK